MPSIKVGNSQLYYPEIQDQKKITILLYIAKESGLSEGFLSINNRELDPLTPF